MVVHKTVLGELDTWLEPAGLCASVAVKCKRWHGISNVLILFHESYFKGLCQFMHN